MSTTATVPPTAPPMTFAWLDLASTAGKRLGLDGAPEDGEVDIPVRDASGDFVGCVLEVEALGEGKGDSVVLAVDSVEFEDKELGAVDVVERNIEVVVMVVEEVKECEVDCVGEATLNTDAITVGPLEDDNGGWGCENDASTRK